jgi:hypothetical protein
VHGKVFQQAELAHGGKNALARYPYCHGSRINLEFTDLDYFRLRGPTRTPQHSADARQQFTRTERFRNVVVAPQLETFDAVEFAGSCGEKNDGDFG